MNIFTVYTNIFPITKSLQEHHLRAASVGAFIIDHWKTNVKVNKDTIIKSLLIHDMGNIIKFDLENPSLMTEDELKNIGFWKKQQAEYRERYKEEHIATHEIARQLGVPEEVEYLISHMGSAKIKDTLQSDNWNLKVVSYSDMRCAPSKIVTINERFEDVKLRYKNKDHPLADPEEVERRKIVCLELEKQLQDNLDISLDEVNDKTLIPYKDQVSRYPIP